MADSRPPDIFATTHWSVVLEADTSSPDRSLAALQTLCEAYWYPLYVFVRHRGFAEADAEELTQEFFHQFLKREGFRRADQRKGKFRAFLLASMKHFLANEWDRRKAQKRGGDKVLLSFDHETARSRFDAEAHDADSPDQLYDRRWVLTLLEKVLTHLKEEYRSGGREPLFEALKPALTGERLAASHESIGATLGMSVGAVGVAVHRLRKRYRQLLRDEIASTVASSDDIDNELRQLFAALG